MKKIGILLLSFLFSGSIILASCDGGTGETKKAANESEMTAPVTEIQDYGFDSKDEMMARGKAIYDEKCIICHMADGKGIPGAFPPLAESDYLVADKVRAVAQVINGSNEPMEVNGVTYTTPMTPQVDNKKDAVAVINYVLNNFGNDGGFVTLEEVEDVTINPR